jgi:hypothetical protein
MPYPTITPDLLRVGPRFQISFAPEACIPVFRSVCVKLDPSVTAASSVTNQILHRSVSPGSMSTVVAAFDPSKCFEVVNKAPRCGCPPSHPWVNLIDHDRPLTEKFEMGQRQMTTIRATPKDLANLTLFITVISLRKSH